MSWALNVTGTLPYTSLQKRGAAVEVSSLKCECSEQSLRSVFSVTYEAI